MPSRHSSLKNYQNMAKNLAKNEENQLLFFCSDSIFRL